jgi:D-alanyl-lipoteichoic acid acyltransferase DltB (MBOAT superfamily)
MAMMFNFCKVTSLVCTVSDGEKIKRLGKDGANLKKREIEYANEDGLPNFLDFWSYLYFVGGAISGPWYEFKDFQRYMRGQGHYKQIPSTVKPALQRVFNIVVFIAI